MFITILLWYKGVLDSIVWMDWAELKLNLLVFYSLQWSHCWCSHECGCRLLTGLVDSSSCSHHCPSRSRRGWWVELAQPPQHQRQQGKRFSLCNSWDKEPLQRFLVLLETLWHLWQVVHVTKLKTCSICTEAFTQLLACVYRPLVYIYIPWPVHFLFHYCLLLTMSSLANTVKHGTVILQSLVITKHLLRLGVTCMLQVRHLFHLLLHTCMQYTYSTHTWIYVAALVTSVMHAHTAPMGHAFHFCTPVQLWVLIH